MRYHLHIADGGDPSSTVTAATLFAHLTLRCGHLRSYLLLSASTTDAKRNREATLQQHNAARVVQLAASAAAVPSSSGSTDDQVLLAAEALLRGEKQLRAPLGDETVWGGSIAAVKDRILPYHWFGCNFAESEAHLARSCGRYFDFIATADVASFDYLLDFYLALRAGEADGNITDSAVPRRRRKVGLVHILCGEPARAGHLLQRFLELLLEVDSKAPELAEEDAVGEDEGFMWINRADGVVAQLYQLLGVNVLFAVV
ncbi:hypothetical protein DQ04_03141080 [Trypanosoma grayi]|uniref:hypothetical protein n=1 Tax=Trypanosoma grayi TaxID=71804 RepID=UPI0004F447E1|nr:hypothetical protein DQ04_03141080 [Trypanosoma grayi]KEG10936.1 hypothetical protein DQ04_03141080 [Trypanosoma grayi]